MNWRVLLFLLSSIVAASVADEQADKAELRVPFVYEMHLNSTEGVATNIDEGLLVLEQEVGTRMMEVLEDSKAAEYASFESRPYDTACETDRSSDECRSLESDVILNIPETTNRVDASFATIDEVQEFVKDFNAKYDRQIYVGYSGPFRFNATFVVQLAPVERKMNENEIAIFEQVWLNMLRKYDPNVEILKVTVIFQNCPLCLEDERRERRGLGAGGRLLQRTKINYVHVRIDGRCNDCSSDSTLYNDVHDRNVDTGADAELTSLETEFTNEVRKAAEDPSSAGLTNGEEPTLYFDDPTSATIAAVEAPEAPVDPDQIMGLKDPLQETEFNFMILALLGAAAVIVLGGVICVLVNKRQKAKLMEQRDSDADDYLSSRNVGTSSHVETSDERVQRHPERSMEEESVDETMVYTTAEGGVEEAYLRH